MKQIDIIMVRKVKSEKVWTGDFVLLKLNRQMSACHPDAFLRMRAQTLMGNRERVNCKRGAAFHSVPEYSRSSGEKWCHFTYLLSHCCSLSQIYDIYL